MPLSWSEGWLSIDGEGGAEYIPEENNGACRMDEEMKEKVDCST